MRSGKNDTNGGERPTLERVEERSAAPRWRAVTGAALLVVLLAYAALAYYGFGPHPKGAELAWWEPRRFLHGSSLLGVFGANRNLAIAVLTAPAFLLAAGVYAAGRSSLAGTAAVWAALATGLFIFYGESAPTIWRFFGWRGTVVLLSFAAVAAVALLAPLLAAGWLRRGWALRAATYLPLVFLVLALERNVTGTDPALAFSVSPWPGVTVFGIDGVASAVAGALGCLALLLAAWRLRGRSIGAAAAALAAVAAVAAAWFFLGPRGGVLPLGVALGLGAVALAAVGAAADAFSNGVRSAAGCAALGAVLLAVPIAGGRAWVHLDYAATRNHQAHRIIEALATYQKRKGVFPEHLGALVKAGLLKRVPEPRIGFAFLGRPQFSYEDFGSDYALEFAAPGWVQCAYTPAWQESSGEGDEASAEEGAGSGAEGESLPGSWSCPAKPPDLW